MTRDEAIKTLMKYQGDHDPERAGHWIDGLNALGILKLDEPKRAADKLRDELASRGYGHGWANLVEKAMEAANLKLVEK